MPPRRCGRKDGFVLRPARQEDAERYYEDNFAPLDPEIARLTGCSSCFSKEEVTGFFKQCVACPDRYDFVLVSPQGRIVGESVINEMDMQLRSANFRVALFHPEACGKGTGSWMIRCTLEFAFQALRLHRLSLDVFSFNQRPSGHTKRRAFAARAFCGTLCWTVGPMPTTF